MGFHETANYPYVILSGATAKSKDPAVGAVIIFLRSARSLDYARDDVYDWILFKSNAHLASYLVIQSGAARHACNPLLEAANYPFIPPPTLLDL